MSRKIIVVLIIIVMFCLIFIFKFKNSQVIENNGNNEVINNSLEIEYDDENAVYYIKDNKTNNILHSSKTKADLQIYLDNPDYNSNPLDIE